MGTAFRRGMCVAALALVTCAGSWRADAQKDEPDQLSSAIPAPRKDLQDLVRRGLVCCPVISTCGPAITLEPPPQRRAPTRPVTRPKPVELRSPADLRRALIALPIDAWPYGRAAEIQQCFGADPTDLAAARRTQEVLDVLATLHVQWVARPR